MHDSWADSPFCVSLLFILFLGGLCWVTPRYMAYSDTLEAQTTVEVEKTLAKAEVERAKGIAEANRIIGDSLKEHGDYLEYMQIQDGIFPKGKGQ